MISNLRGKKSFVTSVGVIGTTLFYFLLNSGNGNNGDFGREEVNHNGNLNIKNNSNSSRSCNIKHPEESKFRGIKEEIEKINNESCIKEEIEKINNESCMKEEIEKINNESCIDSGKSNLAFENINSECSFDNFSQVPKPPIRRRKRLLSISTQDSGIEISNELINEQIIFITRLQNHFLFKELNSFKEIEPSEREKSDDLNYGWITKELIKLRSEYEDSIIKNINIEDSIINNINIEDSIINNINIEDFSSIEILILFIEGLYKEFFKGLLSNFNINNEDVKCTGFLIDDILKTKSVLNNYTLYYSKLNKLFDFINYDKKLPEFEFYCGMIFINKMHRLLEMRRHGNLRNVLMAYNSLYLFMAEKRFNNESHMLFPNCKYFINIQKRFEIPHNLFKTSFREEIHKNYFYLDILLGLYKVPIIMNQYSTTRNKDCKKFFTNNINFILSRIYTLKDHNSEYLKKVEVFVMNIAKNCVFN